ncbi:probable 39S ribosomal protein L49, mitochondrial [Cimex lectularius]|uniref:Large ribosomal subunit protein mL49 n=1 Tax=Cimex lectularius TaxID=79782 RepID=A0A8I6S548_CIMLE|nr:probable 39S ribosomal protein L49, mitochondrial [Cimex lectularius]
MALRSRLNPIINNIFNAHKYILNADKVSSKPLVLSRNIAVIKPERDYDPSKTIDYEVSKDENEWKYVVRALPLKFIPEVVKKDAYPSGWKPQSESAMKFPYYIRRSKNHMIPVYLHFSHRNTRRLTHIHHIAGDIWLLEKELRNYLTSLRKYKIGIRVDEVGGKLVIRGDHVNNIKNWLSEKGF